MKAFHAAEDILIGEDNVLAPLYFYTQPYMLKDNIKGMYYTPLGYLLLHGMLSYALPDQK